MQTEEYMPCLVFYLREAVHIKKCRGILILIFLFFASRQVHAQTNQTVTNGSATTAVTFPGSGCVYNWVNDNPSIGLPASGTGSIPSFAAVNNGSGPVTATITAAPAPAGFAYVPNYNDGTVSVINIFTNSVVTTIPVGSQPSRVSVSPDGSTAYVVNYGSNNLSVISTATNTVTATVTVGTQPSGVTESRNGGKIYVTSGNTGTVSVIDAATYTIIATVPVGLNPQGIVTSPDGNNVYVANYDSNTLSVINTATNVVISTISVGLNPGGVAISPDGRQVYVTNSHQGTVSVINTLTSTVVSVISVESNPYGVVISPDGTRLYVTNNGSNTVSVINTTTNTVVAIITTPPTGAPTGASMSANGYWLYVVNHVSNSVSVINTVSNIIVANIPVGSGPVSLGNFISDGSGCNSLYVTFTITVNPRPGLPPAVTATTPTGTISACVGSPSASPNVAQLTVSGSSLTGDITATAPAGFEISLSAGSGYGNSLTLTQVAGSVPGTVIYVRSSASAQAGNISGNVVLTSAGAADQQVAVSGTINALPTIALISNQTFAAGTVTTGVTFAGTANSFTWVNDTPGIGLPASGTGYIDPFTAVNTGSNPVVAKITVTPQSVGFAYIANSSSNSVSAINTITNQIGATIPVGSQPYGVSVSPDGKRVYVTNEVSNTVSVINAITNAVVATIPVESFPISAAVSPDGSHVYVVNSGARSVSVINTATNAVQASIPVGAQPSGVAVSTDGQLVFVANGGSNTVAVINAASNAVVGSIAVGASPFGIAVSPDGSRIYVSNINSNTISVINIASQMVTATITTGALPHGISVSPDGNYLYVANFGGNTLSVINTSSNTVTATIQVGLSPYGVSVSSDGSLVYVTNSRDNTVSVISTATNALISTVPVGAGPGSFGNFVTAGTGCTGVPTSFTIAVNPSPLSPVVSRGILSGSISACAGTASAAPDILQFTVFGTSLAGDITAGAPAGFEVSLTANGGYGNNVTITASGSTVNNIVVYVRSAASAPAGNITGNVVLSSPGATTQNIAVTATINPLPLINAVATQTVTDGAATKPVNFSGTAATFNWVNDQPLIGLPGSGTGNLSSFKAVNTGSSPLTATITVTGVSNAGCTGQPIVFSITVNPPGANNVADKIVVPNTFTPNGDGINDTWNIKNLDTFPNCTVEVYNRYGEKVYSSIGYGAPWDGRYDGGKLPVSTYFYMIDLKNGGKILSGSITIIR